MDDALCTDRQAEPGGHAAGRTCRRRGCKTDRRKRDGQGWGSRQARAPPTAHQEQEAGDPFVGGTLETEHSLAICAWLRGFAPNQEAAAAAGLPAPRTRASAGGDHGQKCQQGQLKPPRSGPPSPPVVQPLTCLPSRPRPRLITRPLIIPGPCQIQPPGSSRKSQHYQEGNSGEDYRPCSRLRENSSGLMSQLQGQLAIWKKQ